DPAQSPARGVRDASSPVDVGAPSARMSHILYAWELGRGYGHVAGVLPLVRKLRRDGHTVTLALRDLSRVDVLLSGDALPVLQAARPPAAKRAARRRRHQHGPRPAPRAPPSNPGGPLRRRRGLPLHVRRARSLS